MPRRLLAQWVDDDELSELWVYDQIYGIPGTKDTDDVFWAIQRSGGSTKSYAETLAIRRPLSKPPISEDEAERRI